MVKITTIDSFQDTMRADMDAAADAEASGATRVAERDPLTGGLAAPAVPAEHAYDVGPDGTVRDWREVVRDRAAALSDDMTVSARVHTITDDDERRFSGGGSGDAQQQSLFLVPSDASFNNRQFRDAPELANVAEKLIGEHGYLDNLRACRIRYFWKRKTGVSKGRYKIGYLARVSGLLAHAYVGVDFLVWLSATTAREAKFNDTQIGAAVLHQLCHIGEDDNGNWIKLAHDFEGFAAEIRAYGPWTGDLRIGSEAFRVATQLGLDLDADGDGDDAGVAEDQTDD